MSVKNVMPNLTSLSKGHIVNAMLNNVISTHYYYDIKIGSE